MIPVYIAIEQLNFPEPVAAGMDWTMLGHLTGIYRKTNGDVDPIIVRPEGTSRFSITDGRHRVVACMIAGRKNVLAIVEES